uniref:DNA2/NAM7 helicase-like C-terminal domain-containing protein n=1 Tax=Panagrolaimus sp. JU765 TaxID=591449 RepID=A0AC34Q966_9BILA
MIEEQLDELANAENEKIQEDEESAQFGPERNITNREIQQLHEKFVKITSKRIKLTLLSTTTNMASVNVIEGLTDLDNPPLMFMSVSSMPLIHKVAPQVLGKCSLLGHCKRVLQQNEHQMEPVEIQVLKIAIRELERNQRQILNETDKTAKTLTDLEEEAQAGELDEQPEVYVQTSESENTESMKNQQKNEDKLFIVAFLIIVKYSPPAILVGTTAMCHIRRAYFRHLVKALILDEAGTTPQYEILALLASFPSARYLLAVGDLEQLPPFSRDIYKHVRKLGGQSVLESLEATKKCQGICRLQLTKSFRFPVSMLPMIQQQISHDLDVHHGHNLADHTLFKGILRGANHCVQFLDVKGEEQNSLQTSWKNAEHSQVVLQIVKRLRQSPRHRNLSIGVICYYTGQVQHLNSILPADLNVDRSTIEKFQGREKDIIIVVLTRTYIHYNFDFINDRQRRNVALTRARRGLIIIGDAELLARFKNWADTIKFFKRRNQILPFEIEKFEFKDDQK